MRMSPSVPCATISPPWTPAPGPRSTTWSAVADRVLVVLDDDDRVAEIAQAPQRFEQPVVVALVQADAGFVQHVEHARQAGADLAGEADALAFPARQGAADVRSRLR
jgi:hypothetical protein